MIARHRPIREGTDDSSHNGTLAWNHADMGFIESLLQSTFQASHPFGVCLQVGTKKVECTPPDGMVAKKWGES